LRRRLCDFDFAISMSKTADGKATGSLVPDHDRAGDLLQVLGEGQGDFSKASS